MTLNLLCYVWWLHGICFLFNPGFNIKTKSNLFFSFLFLFIFLLAVLFLSLPHYCFLFDSSLAHFLWFFFQQWCYNWPTKKDNRSYNTYLNSVYLINDILILKIYWRIVLHYLLFFYNERQTYFVGFYEFITFICFTTLRIAPWRQVS